MIDGEGRWSNLRAGCQARATIRHPGADPSRRAGLPACIALTFPQQSKRTQGKLPAMAEPHDPSPTGGAAPTVAELFDPAAFAVRLAEARQRRSRVLAERNGPALPPQAVEAPPSPRPLRRFHRGFALGLALGLVAASLPAASLLRLAAAPAPAPVAGVAVRTPFQPGSSAAPALPAAQLALAAPAAPAQFLGSALTLARLDAASRPQPRPEGLRPAGSVTRMSTRNRPAAPSLPGLVTAILTGLATAPAEIRPERLFDGPPLGSIDIRRISGKLLETSRKSTRKAAGSGKHRSGPKAKKSKASKARKSSRKR
ncbi:MAG TPA: hypothetical protein PKA33_01395 [Amaricoccus sp.]|nr:hypothetical protein [Amaricoccus sp.]HMQ92573.1 hypothetical protein [Amaricoccus sp.]HMR61236.1 hypothetical protein [Amaricoccus sp.]HMT98000.1 hypothetical protein [Amaricoccus sp.]